MTTRSPITWRIMALLVEALFDRQFVTEISLAVDGATRVDVVVVLTDAGMVRVGRTSTWEPGVGTYPWLVHWYHGIEIGRLRCG